jgi:hypothetical protein
MQEDLKSYSLSQSPTIHLVDVGGTAGMRYNDLNMKAVEKWPRR